MIEPLITSALKIVFRDAFTARSVSNALLPDNVNIPSGMKIRQAVRGNTIRVTISVESQDHFSTLISTLDEFVTHIKVAVEALEKTN